MILKVDLDNFVRKSEHDGMPCSHPLFDIDNVLHFSIFWYNSIFSILLFCGCFWFILSFQVALEMLKKGDFLLQIFWILSKSVLLSYILLVTRSTFHVIDMVTVGV